MSNVSTDIYNTPVKKGVAIAWVNSYSAVVVKTSGATLLFDPVGMDVPAGASLDLIAITHGHSDHWEPKLINKIQGRTGSTVAAPPSLADKLRQDQGNDIPSTSYPAVPQNCHSGERSDEETPSLGAKILRSAQNDRLRVTFCGNPPHSERGTTGSQAAGGIDGSNEHGQKTVRSIVSMLPGDEITVGGTTVCALRCDHAAVEPVAYQVTTPDGLTVYLPGDTMPFYEMGDLPTSTAGAPGHGQTTGRRVDVLCWMGTTLTDGAKIAHLVQPKIVLSYAITPPAAGKRAYEILTALTPNIPFHPLDRHQVFVCPGGE